ncbi:collagenase-like [Pectinophora gossypiella]|nr:collagenase-like [Pectinophora gossypiella]
MRAALLLGFVGLATALRVVLPEDGTAASLGYHEAVGIPQANRIKLSEENLMADDASRIVGGSFAPANVHPYLGGLIISLEGISGNSVCGSTLISANRLVTAARCWFDGRHQATQFLVVLGSQYLFFGGTRIPTSTVISHPQYSPATLVNDIAVVYLPNNVFFNQRIQPLALPSATDLAEEFVGTWAIAAGYGRTSDQQTSISTGTQISHVTLQVQSVAQCQSLLGLWVQPSMLCTSGAGGVGICAGDTGGPLVLNRNGQNILVGIASFTSDLGCQVGLPSVFTRVTSYISFIIQNI